MLEFTSHGEPYVRESLPSWTTHFISAGQLPDGIWDPFDLAGETVLLDGIKQRVLGVEAFCVHRTPEHPYRLAFGIVVRGA